MFYAAIAALSALVQERLGSGGVIAVGAISGLADLDAITIAMSSSAAAGNIQLNSAEQVVVAAMLSNTLVKMGIAVIRGEHMLWRIVIASLGASVLVLAAGLLRSFVGF